MRSSLGLLNDRPLVCSYHFIQDERTVTCLLSAAIQVDGDVLSHHTSRRQMSEGIAGGGLIMTTRGGAGWTFIHCPP